MKRFALVALVSSFAASPLLHAEVEPTKESQCFFLDRECQAIERIKQRKDDERRADAEIRERYQQKKAQRDAEYDEKMRLSVERAAKERREADIAKQEKAEADKLEQEQYLQRWKADQAKKQAALDAAYANEEKRERSESKRRESVESEVKSRCGADYKTPRVGMTIDRVRACVGPVKVAGQVNRADGVATQYTYGSLWINVLHGYVIAWGH